MFESDEERRPLVGETARDGFDSIAEEPAGTPTGKPGLAGEVARQIETKREGK
jgi:hypothetical protein